MTIPPGVPAELLSEWSSAEERLYPIIMLRPDLYQRAVELVRKVADELASCDDLAALVKAWPDAADIAYRASALALLPLADLDITLVAGAGFSVRYRELAGPAARSQRLARLADAAEKGDTWVLVSETGSPGSAVVPWVRLEMHVPTGTGLAQTVEADQETGAARFGLEVVQLDPVTGERLGSDDDPVMEESFDDRTEWTAAVEAQRRRLEGGSG
ncbi:MAG: cytochrome c oxidase subunit Vb family protein [Actinomycetota bacterium]|nr:cytochrome c oxidase subunit Vb family protein [Actinomycetota bacterium]